MILNIIIKASNGVIKHKQVTFNIIEKPVITNIKLYKVSRNRCSSNVGNIKSRRELQVFWTKKSSLGVKSVSYSIDGGSAILVNFNPPIMQDSNVLDPPYFPGLTQKILTDCYPDSKNVFQVEIYITDTSGQVSKVFNKIVNNEEF